MTKQRDIAQLVDGLLLVTFAQTGQTQVVSLLRDINNMQLSIKDNAILADAPGLPPLVVERFTSPALAQQGMSLLVDALRRGRSGGDRRGWRRVLPWIIGPLLGIAALEVLYFSIVPAPTLPIPVTSVAATPIAPAAAVPAVPPASAPAVAPAQFSAALGDAIKDGRYSVRVSSSGGSDLSKTLYLFEDPDCIYCRKLEPQLAELAKNYTIEVFPVSVIGGHESAEIAASVLCQADRGTRAATWKDAMAGRLEKPNAATDECRMAVSRNDEVFRGMQFFGTPTLVNGNGVEIPRTVPHTAQAIDAWMRTGTARQSH